MFSFNSIQYQCQLRCHPFEPCGKPLEEGYGGAVVCAICMKDNAIAKQRSGAASGLKNQAERMLATSNQLFGAIEVGDNVAVPAPNVDKSATDMKNLVAVVLEKTEDGFYKLGTTKGKLECLYARNEIQPTKEKLISIDQVPDKEYSLRALGTK